jgi:D-alanyl-lipoteichoic acid acyltransferase DltB (MBOAT superfamily)
VARGKYLPTIKEFFSILITFCLTVFAWIFFRASSLTHAYHYILGIFTPSLFTIPMVKEDNLRSITIVFVILFLVVEWIGREHQYAIQNLFPQSKAMRWATYYLLLISIFLLAGSNQQFIYFQF